MQVAVSCSVLVSRFVPLSQLTPRVLPCACAAAFLFGSLPAHAGDIPAPDARAIADLESRALHADPREQVQIYADLADKISLVAAKQIAEGDAEAAERTLHQFESASAAIESDLLKNSKGLKKTEVLLHTTHRRMADLGRAASGDMKPVVLNALHRLDKAQTALLGMIFEQ